MRSLRQFGWIIAALGVAQAVLYASEPMLGRGRAFYFDPRIGIGALQSMLGPEPESPGVLQWAATIWQVAIGCALLAGRVSGVVYMVGEAVLAAPSVAFFALVALSNVSPSHGFSARELLLPVPVFVVFSVLPFIVALQLQRQGVRAVLDRGRPTSG